MVKVVVSNSRVVIVRVLEKERIVVDWTVVVRVLVDKNFSVINVGVVTLIIRVVVVVLKQLLTTV